MGVSFLFLAHSNLLLVVRLDLLPITIFTTATSKGLCITLDTLSASIGLFPHIAFLSRIPADPKAIFFHLDHPSLVPSIVLFIFIPPFCFHMPTFFFMPMDLMSSPPVVSQSCYISYIPAREASASRARAIGSYTLSSHFYFSSSF